MFTAIKARVEPWSLLPLGLVVRLLLLAHAGQQLLYGRHVTLGRNRPPKNPPDIEADGAPPC